MSKKKKIFVLVTMVLVLAVAAYLNIALLNNNQNTNGDMLETANFFTSYRQERQQVRSEEMLQLDSIIALEGSEYATSIIAKFGNEVADKKEAAAQKLQLIEIMETEMLLENLIKAKGYSDVVVRIGTNSQNINVAVKADELTREDTAKIYSVIRQETNKSPEFVQIVPVK